MFHKNTTGMVKHVIKKEPASYCCLYVAGAKRLAPSHQMIVLSFEFTDVFLCLAFHYFAQNFQG